MHEPIVFIIAGIILLYKGAEWLVGSSARIAQNLRVPKVIIGLTVIAVGTSLPELMTSLTASLSGSPDVALGNILGSNLANLGLVLALAVIIKPLKTHVEDLYRDAPWLIFGSVLLLVLALDGKYSRPDGLLLFGFSLIFFIYIVARVKHGRITEEELPFQEFAIKARDRVKNMLLIIVGLGTLLLGAKMLTVGALELASIFNFPELIVGITLVAVGTSLPELAASTWSSLHGKAEVTLGNVIGSNISNIFLILGLVSLASPIAVSQRALLLDIPVVLIFTFLAILMIYTREKLTRLEGGVLLAVYLVYIVWSFF